MSLFYVKNVLYSLAGKLEIKFLVGEVCMANKIKEIYPNNLLKIREFLGYTQEEMGKILDVGERMICNYETGESNLPIDKAILLSQKYNYSLDWIYNIKKTQTNSISIHEHSKQVDKFVVDIRDFVSYSDDMYHFNIPDNYQKYISELNSIISSNKTDNEKKRLKAELDGKYKKSNKGNVIWRISIPAEKMPSYIHFDSSYIPFANAETDSEYEPTEEQLKSAISFLDEITK